MSSAISPNDLLVPKDSTSENPYLTARKEWDERYGSLIKRAQHWRGAAVLALLVALAEEVVILGVATRPKTVPYVVAVDSFGRVVASGAVERSSEVSERMKASALGRWIQDLRGVTSDGLAQAQGNRSCVRHDWERHGGTNAGYGILQSKSAVRSSEQRNSPSRCEYDTTHHGTHVRN